MKTKYAKLCLFVIILFFYTGCSNLFKDIFNIEYMYTLNFLPNGGSGSMQSVTIRENERLPTCAYSRVGYMFVGWSTEPSGNVKYDDSTSLIIEDLEYELTEDGKEITLYAQWQRSDTSFSISDNVISVNTDGVVSEIITITLSNNTFEPISANFDITNLVTLSDDAFLIEGYTIKTVYAINSKAATMVIKIEGTAISSALSGRFKITIGKDLLSSSTKAITSENSIRYEITTITNLLPYIFDFTEIGIYETDTKVTYTAPTVFREGGVVGLYSASDGIRIRGSTNYINYNGTNLNFTTANIGEILVEDPDRYCFVSCSELAASGDVTVSFDVVVRTSPNATANTGVIVLESDGTVLAVEKDLRLLDGVDTRTISATVDKTSFVRLLFSRGGAGAGGIDIVGISVSAAD